MEEPIDWDAWTCACLCFQAAEVHRGETRAALLRCGRKYLVKFLLSGRVLLARPEMILSGAHPRHRFQARPARRTDPNSSISRAMATDAGCEISQIMQPPAGEAARVGVEERE
jgi:hypothetical protein